MFRKLKNIYHLIIATLSVVRYLYPAKNLIVIGVTGTDGKTTTSSLIYQILKLSGKNVSLITSVNAKIGNDEYDTGFHVTTPDPMALQRFIKKAKDIGSKYLVLETTSHALDQNRVIGCNYYMGVITNVTHEHLDYHLTYTKYLKTKAKLFKNVKFSVLNIEDKSYDFLKKVASGKVITYGLHKGNYNLKNFKFETKLPGTFNQYNCLAAIASCKSLGIEEKIIQKGVLTFNPVVGRMDEIKNDRGIKILIDFAHTPNALEKALKVAKGMSKRRVISVFGSAGLRDKTKRPLMGHFASSNADVVILTAEDPRTENVNDIIDQIAQGIKTGKQLFKVPDRQEAINKAINEIGRKGDLIIITGKGHEKSMCFGTKEYPWSDYEAVQNALKEQTS